jgi:hypothetical protein
MTQPADAPVAAGIVGTPLDMLLWCPCCGTQHVDAPDKSVPTSRIAAACARPVVHLAAGGRACPRCRGDRHTGQR